MVALMASTRKATADRDPWMSLVAAARALDTTRQTVLTLAIKGDIEAQHVAGRTVVSRASVERVRRSKASAA